MHSNLGGMGPDAANEASGDANPPTIRYANVGSYSLPDGEVRYFDLVLSNRTGYTPYDASRNDIHAARFAQIDLACNERVTLRASTVRSCAGAPSCKLCDALSPSLGDACYARGCACYAATVSNRSECNGTAKRARRASYACAHGDEPLVLPGGVLTTMTVYDLDTGVDGEYEETLHVPGYAYYKTPLRPASDNAIDSTVGVDLHQRTFRSTASGSPADRPTDPQVLTDAQASKGVQFFFVATHGYVEAEYSVSSSASDCTGRTLLFAGDAALCAPPPPAPPAPPPQQPPPQPPPQQPQQQGGGAE